MNTCLVCGREVDPLNGEELRNGLCSRECLERFNESARASGFPEWSDPWAAPQIQRPPRVPRRRRCRVCDELHPPSELHNGMCGVCFEIGPPPGFRGDQASEEYVPPERQPRMTTTNNYGLYVGAPARPVEGTWLGTEAVSGEAVVVSHASQLHGLEPSAALQRMIAGWAEDRRRRQSHPSEQRSGWFDAPDFDVWACLEYHPQQGWGHVDIDAVLATVAPRRDVHDDNWHWVMRLRDGRYVYLVGWCYPQMAGWAEQSTAEAHLGETPYDCLIGDHAPPDAVYRELVRQIVEDMLRVARTRIAASMAASPTHTVYQAMGFETNHCWLCENCGFVSTDDLAARQHSEMPEAKAGVRRIRRERSSAPDAKPLEAKRRLRGPRRDL